MSQQDGVIGVYLVLNDENMPSIRIKYAKDVTTGEKLREIANQPKWNIEYKDGPKEENGRFTFEQEGKIIPVL